MKDSGVVDFVIRESKLSDLEDIVELWKDLSSDQLGKDKYYKLFYMIRAVLMA